MMMEGKNVFSLRDFLHLLNVPMVSSSSSIRSLTDLLLLLVLVLVLLSTAMKYIVAVLALAALAVAAPTTSELQTMFQDFKTTYGKAYLTAAEEATRFKVFSDNVDFINTHNARFEQGLETYTVGVNQFADLTRQEFAAMYLRPINRTRPLNVVYLPEVKDVNAVDW